jgi:hypothetical protein
MAIRCISVNERMLALIINKNKLIYAQIAHDLYRGLFLYLQPKEKKWS